MATVSAVSMLMMPFGTRAGLNDIFKGWAWTPNVGWISMNSSNTNAANGYGVNTDDARNVRGWAWSSNLGWICFGDSCQGSPPGGGPSWAQIDNAADPQLHGWARIYSFYVLDPASVEGWISLNCSSYGSYPARDVCTAAPYRVYIEISSGLLRGYGWSCTTSDGTSSCTSDKYSGGLGWISFNSAYTPPPNQLPNPFGGVPWVQVLYGDLYSKGNVSTPSPFTEQFARVNAYYCIDTGIGATVTHFAQGANCATGSVQTNINIPKQSSKYSNALGRIKLRGYDDQLVPLDLTGLAAGKYGPWQQVNDLNSIPAVLGGKIYDTVSSGDWTLDARTVNNGFGTGSSANGSGLLIVRGNLNITGDIAYQSGSITKLQYLASLGILVLDDGTGTKGNVNISTSEGSPTANISANIFAEGKVSTGTTGDPTTDKALTINGVVVAKQFNFQRVFPGTITTPSEKIVYDGRIVANTPPGMSDFIASLPAISY